MAYPVVSAPYGLKPINLIGGQVFAGSTREYPIPYGYSTNIFYGDIVGLTRGGVQRLCTCVVRRCDWRGLIPISQS